MSAFKINLALIRDCPSLLTLKAALETLGRPSDRDYGVMGVGDVIEGKLPFEFFKTKEQKVPQVDKLDGSLRQPTIRKDDIFKCAVRMASNVTPAQVGTIAVLEVYSGSSASIEKVKELFSVLELADQIPQIEPITLDIMSKLSDVRDGAKLFQLVSAKVKGYKDSADEQIAGTYTVIERPSRLVFEAMGSVGTVTLDTAGTGTRMSVTIRCASKGQLEQFVTMGVAPNTDRTLDNLVRYIAASQKAGALS